MTELYRTFNRYLRDYFGERVYRVPLDAGFTCPNRDGTKALGGCTFCDDRGSGAPTIPSDFNVDEQLKSGIERITRRFKARKFLAYFQAFTNTYAPEAVLRSLYDRALAHPDVVGLCIGTRPDCLDESIMNLLEEYHKRTFVWLEIGLQSAVDTTLDLINRGHTAEDFFDAVNRAHKRGLRVATHLIFGLPGENEAQMKETVRKVASCGVTGVKIHQLCIYKGTAMEKDYRSGSLRLLDEEEYAKLVADALELLSPHQVIMRLVAEGTREEVIAPEWSFEKTRIVERIEQNLIDRGARQGIYFRQ